jgi:PAS domain S-box-containing protein
MAIPLTGYKFWGVINLSDREDGQPFSPQDLFLGWLMGRLLVEILEAREPKEEMAPVPAPPPWVGEELPLGLALVNQDLQVVQANPTLEKLAGFEGKSLAGQKIVPHLGLAPGDVRKLEEAFGEVLAGHKPLEFTSLRTSVASGTGKSPRFLSVKMMPWQADRNGPQGLILVEDVTDLEQLQQRLQLYEHLAIMGKLTLCVVHELNNPLDGIRRYISLALMKKETPPEVERYLTEAQKGLQKMSLSLKSLLFSANPDQAPSRTADNLHTLLQDAIKIMMFQANDQGVQVSFQTQPEFQEMVVEPDLYYVFINVIKNALQAMPKGGKLTIDGNVYNHQVVITFEDTGAGLSPEELELIFHPFYSTKEKVQGLGLGLPICQKIMERHDGRLLVESTKGQGTRVSVILPKEDSGGGNAS